MLYYLDFNLFQYITFRAALAGFSSLFIMLLLGEKFINYVTKLQLRAPSRLEGFVPEEELDQQKKVTPQMGGVLIIFAISVSCFLWMPLGEFFFIFIGNLILFGLIGFYDDYKKIVHKNKNGLSSKAKLLMQIIASVISVSLLLEYSDSNHLYELYIPFIKTPIFVHIPALIIILWSSLVLVSSSNAVNLTDGMDGLATGCTAICAFAFLIFAYLCGNKLFANYLFIPYIQGVGEIAVFTASLIGACLGFLWYNCYPAKIFMGDTGSLALGSSIGLIALLVKQEIILILIGGVFVIEASSSALQMIYFKLTKGKRLFLMAPIHHHFQKKGWTETQIVVRFWLLALIFAALGLASLKIR